MSNIKTNQNTVNGGDVQSLTDQLGDLLNEAKKIKQDITLTNEETIKGLDDIETRVDTSVAKVEQIYSDLDAIEKDAEEKLDKLVKEEAEDSTA